MGKKVIFYLLLFNILLIINVTALFLLDADFNRRLSVIKILAEIEENNSSENQFNYSNAPFNTNGFQTEAKLSDARVANLKSFFRKHGSPLYEFADKIVEESDQNQFDYRLLAAIAMQESNLCKKIPYNSYNCWGWGIYGNITTYFSSYPEAIEVVALGIKKDYIDKGLVTATTIMAKYTPSSNGSWASAVNTFLRDLE